MRRQAQFNFFLLEANAIDEVTEPLEEQWAIPGYNPHKTKQNGTNTKAFEKNEESKQYKVVFHKRVLDPDSFQSYPYEYTGTELLGYGEDWHFSGIVKTAFLSLKLLFTENTVSMSSQ